MALTSIQAYALAKKYTDDSLAGGGAIAGKNCTIESIEPITGGNRITFQWTLDNGTIKTDTLDVMDGVNGADGEDGADGNGIASIAKTSTSGLVDTYTITFTDGNTSTFTVTNGQDGENAQYSTLPEASASNEGQIVQYVGETTSTLTNGFFYKCVEDSGSYSWVQKNVQAGGGGGTGDYDELSNRPKINDVTLTGNKTSSDLGLASASDLANKVDKVTGKGLSTNDYDNTAKGIVDGVTTALAEKQDRIVVTATIASGEDSVDITNANITANSVFDIYTEDNSLCWTDITISGTTATITFDKSVTQATAVKVYIR